jgi:hypothetical protein
MCRHRRTGKKTSGHLKKLREEWVTEPPYRFMFQDEARFGRISDIRRCWHPEPSMPLRRTSVIQENTYAYGVVNIFDGQFESLALPHCDTGCMQIFLDRISFRHKDGKIIMAVDGVGWHKSHTLEIP